MFFSLIMGPFYSLVSVYVLPCLAPLSSLLSNRFGFQPVVMVGGFLISLGMITTAFTTSVNQMYITTGIIAGKHTPHT